jgi:hypothetical protein
VTDGHTNTQFPHLLITTHDSTFYRWPSERDTTSYGTTDTLQPTPSPEIVKIESFALNQVACRRKIKMDDEFTPLISKSPIANGTRSASISTLGSSADWDSEASWVDLKSNAEVLSEPYTGTETGPAKLDKRSEAEKIADIYFKASEVYASAAETYRRILEIKENSAGTNSRLCYTTRGFIRLYESKERTYKTLATKYPYHISCVNVTEAVTRLKMAEDVRDAAECKLRLLENKGLAEAGMPGEEKSGDGEEVLTSGTNKFAEASKPTAAARLRILEMKLLAECERRRRTDQKALRLEVRKKEVPALEIKRLADIAEKARDGEEVPISETKRLAEINMPLSEARLRLAEMKLQLEALTRAVENAARVEMEREEGPVLKIKRVAEADMPISEETREEEKKKMEVPGLRKRVQNWMYRVIGGQGSEDAKTG